MHRFLLAHTIIFVFNLSMQNPIEQEHQLSLAEYKSITNKSNGGDWIENVEDRTTKERQVSSVAVIL